MAPGLTAEVRLRAGTREFSLLDSVRAGCGAQTASYPVVTWGSFLGVKEVGG
jgi:hypothetical protein